MNDDLDGERLGGGWQTEVRRVGTAVFRESGPQSGSVIRLLQHLQDRGFDASPKPIEHGFAPDGREQLTYLEGNSPHPRTWNDDAASACWMLDHRAEIERALR